MKEGLLHEIELSSYIASIMHPLPHPYRMPTTSTTRGAGRPKSEGVLVKVGLQGSHPKKIQFESNSKLDRNNFEILSILNSLGFLNEVSLEILNPIKSN